MAEYIEKDFVLNGMDTVLVAATGIAGNDAISNKVCSIIKNIRAFVASVPAADVAPVVYGTWKVGYTDKENKTTGVECSECNAFYELDLFDFGLCYNYCPNCGARMDGSE